MLDVLVVLAALQTSLVVDDDLELSAVLAVLLTLGLVNVDRVEDLLIYLESEFLARLD